MAEDPSQFLRKEGLAGAARAWGQRPVQGAVAREVLAGAVSRAELDLGLYTAPQDAGWFAPWLRPREGGHHLDGVLWKMRSYAGASWTAALHTNPVARAAAASTQGPNREDEEVELAERCPLCWADRGDFRHLAVWCQHDPLPAVRETLWDAVETKLQQAGDEEWWQQAERAAAVAHPRGWTGLGSEEERARWPILTQTGWLRPTEGEAILAAGLRERRPEERGHDLGYRGVIPAGLAAVWRKEDPAGPRAAVGQIAMATAAMRRIYAEAAKSYAKRAAPVTAAAEEDEEGGASSASDGEAGRAAAARPCKGKWCLARQADTGEEVGVARRKSDLCGRCHHHDRLDAHLELLRRALWVPGRRNLTMRDELVARPWEPKRVLEKYVKQLAARMVPGATEARVLQTMKRAGLTAALPGGRTAAPIPEAAWGRCGCREPRPAARCTWLCTRCRRLLKGEETEEQGCRACGTGGGRLVWCAGCASPRHEAPCADCPGYPVELRGRGGLCPLHGAEFANAWWEATAGAAGGATAAGQAGRLGVGHRSELGGP